jgi:hypothetical protein
VLGFINYPKPNWAFICPLTRGQPRATLDAPAPPGVVPHGGACSGSTYVNVRCAPSLSRIGAMCCALSLLQWGMRVVIPLSLTHTWSLFHWGNTLCSHTHWGTRGVFHLFFSLIVDDGYLP